MVVSTLKLKVPVIMAASASTKYLRMIQVSLALAVHMSADSRIPHCVIKYAKSLLFQSVELASWLGFAVPLAGTC